MQVAASTSEVDVGDVALPQLVSCRRLESLYEILPLVVAVVGVRRRTALARLLHEPVATQEVQERIATRHPTRIEHHAKHLPELHPAYTRIKLADLMHGIKDANLTCQILRIVRLLLVKGLTAMAKQITGSNDGQAMLPVEFFYCLAPDFFESGYRCVLPRLSTCSGPGSATQARGCGLPTTRPLGTSLILSSYVPYLLQVGIPPAKIQHFFVSDTGIPNFLLWQHLLCSNHSALHSCCLQSDKQRLSQLSSPLEILDVKFSYV